MLGITQSVQLTQPPAADEPSQPGPTGLCFLPSLWKANLGGAEEGSVRRPTRVTAMLNSAFHDFNCTTVIL